MRLTALLFTAILGAAPAWAQPPPPSSVPDSPSPAQDAPAPRSGDQDARDHGLNLNLPVSLDRIREALQQPPVLTLRGLDERPHFKVEIQERQKFDELVATILKDVKPTFVPAGGLYAAEQQRQLWPSVDNPLVQPYAAFSQPQLLTILIENLVGKYLAGRAMNAITSAERARAEAAAREDVRQAVAQYCAAQPNAGAGIQICSTPIQ
jgi:hypothetical protein